MDFEIDIASEQLGLGTLADGGSERPSGSRHIFLSDLELRIQQPDLGKGEPLVWDQIQARPVHLQRKTRMSNSA